MKWLIGLVLLCAVAAGGWAYRHYRKLHEAGPAGPVPTAVVVRASIGQTVASTGRVVSNLDVDIKCKASGQIIELPFDVSQTVHKGDLLARLDPVDVQRTVDQATASVQQTRAKVAQAEQSYRVAQVDLSVAKDKAEAQMQSAGSKAKNMRAKANRRKQLVGTAGISQEDIDSADADATQAEAEVLTAKAAVEALRSQELSLEVKKQDITVAQADAASAQAVLDDANQQLRDTTVRSPMDGVVSALDVQKGQIISSGITNIGGGTTILTLSDLAQIFVLASVDESDIGRVQLGQDVRLTADAHPGIVFPGKVVRIASKGVNTNNVITFEVKIEVVGEKKSLLKPEMTANVEIIAAEKRDVPTVPSGAISRVGEKSFVTVMKDGKQEQREVTLGLTDGDKWEVVSGLEEGEQVVLTDQLQSKWTANAATKPSGP